MRGVERRIGIGLLGASRVATYAVIEPARNLPGVEVTAIAARDPARAQAYAAAHGIARWHATYAELLADETVDLVYLGTPPACHAEQALAAIAANKAVLVEKPFSMTAAEAQTVLASAQSAGVLVFEAMHSLHHALFERLSALVGAGEIGKLERIEAEFGVPISRDDPFRWDASLGGGALMDLGVYPLAWARTFGGKDFVVRHAAAEIHHGVDASFDATLQFASGIVASIGASMIAPAPTASLHLLGSGGRINVENPVAPQLGHLIEVEQGGTTRREQVAGPSTYIAQLGAVRDALLDLAPFPRAVDEFIRSMVAIERIREALPK
ncbi:MAG: Gfo/Idh/MocA family oxidoreductase [Sphingomonas bacterium]|nr:Gfo/Idh/MocA family oxidoreductase [Sphingomonas bacterium]